MAVVMNSARLVSGMDVPLATTREFSSFYEAEIGRLVGALTATLADPQLAQDAAQEAMARACQRWGKVGAYDNPAGWCYRVAMNWSTSRWRKRRREIVTSEFDPRISSLESGHSDPALIDALLRLPIEQRSVVVLRVWMDWSIRDTATALGVAEGTVRSRLARALERLRTDLSVDTEVEEMSW